MNQKKLINIGIVPTVREVYPGQFEYCLDKSYKKILNRIYKKYELQILDEKSILKNLNLIIFTGGNDIFKLNKKKKNKIREKIDKKVLSQAIKKNIPVLGICHGMQIIASFFGSKIIKKKHIGNHKIIYFEGKKKYIKIVNSYHNYVIAKLSQKFIPLAMAKDGTIESMLHKNKKILGIMWHPERERNIKNFDIKLIKKICN